MCVYICSRNLSKQANRLTGAPKGKAPAATTNLQLLFSGIPLSKVAQHADEIT